MKKGDETPAQPRLRAGLMGTVASGKPKSTSEKLKRKPSKESAAASGVDSKEDHEDSRTCLRGGVWGAIERAANSFAGGICEN